MFVGRVSIPLGLAGLTLVGLVVFSLGVSSTVEAQITPPKQGVELPQIYHDRVQEDKTAFQFKRAWKAETERVKQNRAHRQQIEGVFTTSSSGSGFRVEGTRRIPVLAGKYSNTGGDPYTDLQLENQLFNGPNPTGTVTDYYDEISYGYINLTGDVLGNQTGGLFQVSQIDTYYEGAPGDNGLGGSAKTGEYLQELLNQSDGWVDFGQYDNDGPDGLPNSGDDDGFVDFVAFVHPEFGGECGGNNMWSHRWVYEGWWGSPFTTNDAAAGGGFIQVSDYTIQPLISCNTSSLIEIGVYAHEFGHAFGLPDLYDTNSGNGTSAGIGGWGLMASGSWGGDNAHPDTPSHMCAWSKEQLGWIDPIVVCQDQLGASLPAAADTGVVYKVFPHGVTDTEYFLVENRVQSGFDTYLLTSGIAVWHIDDDIAGNGDETHKQVDLEEADGLAQLDANANRGDAGDLYPGSSNNQLLDDFTNPNAKDYAGVNTGFSVGNFGGAANPRTLDITAAPCQLNVASVVVNDQPCGNNNGTLDEGERTNLLVGLGNDFSDVTGVAGTLTSLTPGVSVLQDSVFFGTVVCGVVNFGAGEFEIESTGLLPNGTQVDFQLDLTGSGGYASSVTVSLISGTYVLLVEDDGAANTASRFQNAITGAGYTYVYHNTAVSGTPPASLMQAAQAVVWYTGEEFDNTFTVTEQDRISVYLDNGGKLFVTGQDIGYDLSDQGTAGDQTFYETYFHATFVSDTSSDNTLTGVGGDPIGAGLSLNLAGGDGANNSTWPSVIAPGTSASRVFNYIGNDAGTVRYSGAHDVVYMAFNFEAINAAATRSVVMQRVLDWFSPADIIPPTATLLGPVGSEVLDGCGTRVITWSASDNIDVTEVDLSYSDDSGVTYSNVIATGLANTGTYNWTQPGLSGTTFRVKVIARDAFALQGVDMSASDFTIQAAGGATATVVSPSGGESLACNTLTSVDWSVDACAGFDSTEVYYSLDGGSGWTLIATVPAPDSTTAWTTPGTASDSALVRVEVFSAGGSDADTSDAFFSIVDNTPPTVAVIAPNGGETFGTGNAVSIDWSASDDKGVATVDLYYTLNDGGAWTSIATGIASTPPYGWTAPDAVSTDCRVRVVAWDAVGNSAEDVSDTLFTIADDDAPAAAVVTPNGGESIEGGTIANIDATSGDNVAVDSLCVSYSLDNGGNWTVIDCGALSFPYAWTTPGVESDSCLVRVEAWDAAGNPVSDDSDALFSLFLNTTAVPAYLQGVTRPVLLQNHPNPMRARSTFAFYLPADGPVSLQVFDIAGHLVKTVARGTLPGGYHEIAWDGAADDGQAVAEGVYFYILRTDEKRQMRKLVKLR